MKISFIIDKNLNPNSYAFIFPVVINKKNFNEFQIDIINFQPNEVFDIIFVDSKFFLKQFKINDFESIKTILKNLKKKCKKLIYCDNEASIFINNNLFNYIDVYLKGRLPNDISKYKKSFYGQREFTNFYYTKYGIQDEIENYSHTLEDDQIKKIVLGWNNGICDYSYLSIIKKLIFKYSGKIFFNIKKINSKKNNLITARIKQTYNRNTINHHRKIYENLFSNFCKIERIPRMKYYKELKNSKFSFSPFGWGEICYRDFESFLYNCILIKPNMDHIITWPNYFIKNKTYVSIPWDLNDYNLIDKIFKNEEILEDIGAFGSHNYMKYFNNDENSFFVNHFKDIIKKINL